MNGNPNKNPARKLATIVTSERSDFLEIGIVVGTHGVRGELRVKPLCDDPSFFGGFTRLFWDRFGKEEVRVLASRAHKNICLLTLAGVADLTVATALRGRVLYFSKADAPLEEGRYFIADLLYCRVVEVNLPAVEYGHIFDVQHTAAHDIWGVHAADGREHWIPVVDEVVRQVDIENSVVFIAPLQGLFD
jgi:16S rRNA processing protein RimM